MSTTPADLANPAAKPHGTTDDQIAEMESEGQAQGPPAGPVPPLGFIERRRQLPGIDVEPPSAQHAKERRGSAPSAAADPEIDRAGGDR